MTVAVVVVALVSLALAAVVAWPLLGRGEQAPADPRQDELREVEATLARSLAAIREIDFDHCAGNLSTEDFTALDAEERGRAVELIRRRDELAGTTPAGEGEAPTPPAGADAPARPARQARSRRPAKVRRGERG